MSFDAEQCAKNLKQFLQSVQRPGLFIENIGMDDDLIQSGLIDSLVVLQIVVYLEDTYHIDFSTDGFNPENLATMRNILKFIEEKCA